MSFKKKEIRKIFFYWKLVVVLSTTSTPGSFVAEMGSFFKKETLILITDISFEKLTP